MTSPAEHLASRPATALVSTITIDGTRLHAGTKREALGWCLQLLHSGRGGRVATANLDFFAIARRDDRLRSDLAASSLVVIDGAPIAWCARLAGARFAERYAGVDLVRDLVESASQAHPVRLAILGSTSEIAMPAVKRLLALSKHVELVFLEHPPFRPLTSEEVERTQHALANSRANVMLVALGCPKQERLIAEWSTIVPGVLWIGIGGTLDFYAGRRRRAPLWAQRTGLEWVFRLVQDPRRLAGRYLVRDLPVLGAILSSVIAARLAGARVRM